MKTIKFLFLALSMVMVMVITSCDSIDLDQTKTELTGFFTKPHPLRKMVNQTVKESHLSGGFFLFAGSVRGESSEKAKLTFSWNAGSNKYVTSTFNLDDIMVELDSSVTEPFVTFQVDDWFIENRSTNKLIKLNEGVQNYILSDINSVLRWSTVTVVCNPDDWTINIQLPLQEEIINN